MAMLSKEQILLISLLFAFRFKQQILPWADAAKKIEGHDSERLRSIMMRIERELMILENEAEEYGFNLSEEQFDRPHITDNISSKDDCATVRKSTADWAALRKDLIALLSDLRNPKTPTSAADVSEKVINGLVAMREPNKRFTEAVVRELMISQGLDVSVE